MLFNSYDFIFVFLPAAFGVFMLLGRASRRMALGWLGFASLAFYAWWRPANVLILGPLIVFNFGLAKLLLRLGQDGQSSGVRTAILTVGVVVDVAFLGFFKYVDFVLASLNEYGGYDFALTHVVLPLAVSFISFQLITLLIDVHARRVESFTFREFGLFVLFFPQLIAGPIVHFREMMPQFRSIACRFHGESVAIGLTIFCVGLFKKVVLADGLALYVTPIFEHAASGGPVHLIHGWFASVGFTLQIYFDFSGYSEMAVGLARCIGVRLPINFDSPLKARSIIDHWLRWHITLTRFLTSYVYNPIALKLTRRRARKGLQGFSRRGASVGSFLQVVAGPTILTMCISGLWHGTGFTFMLWGLLHGVYLAVNHASRYLGPRLLGGRENYDRVMATVALPVTFIAVAVAMVLFRAPSVETAAEVFRGMMGLNGLAVPQAILDGVGPVLNGLAIPSETESALDFVMAGSWIATTLFIALACPNVFEFTARFKPVLGVWGQWAPRVVLPRSLQWSPSLLWAAVVCILAASAIMHIGQTSEFLYWQF
jgi:D-alanyl-lipoteichoic acid acyltransferase DltB (MBOAT superfamily)